MMQHKTKKEIYYGKKKLHRCRLSFNKEENYYGVPMKIVLYKNRDGTTISQDFISQLDPQPQGVEIIDSPYLKSSLDIAKEIID